MGLRQRIRDRYGTERGLVRLWLAHAEWMTGRLESFARIDWNRVQRLVFICQGNINRSAYAGALAHSRGVEAASLGLATTTGAAAHPLAIETADARGLVSLHQHQATDISDFDRRAGDLMVAMEVRQARHVASAAAARDAQVTLLGIWGRPRRPHIHDPYYTLSPPYFDTCFSEIERHTDALCAAFEGRQG